MLAINQYVCMPRLGGPGIIVEIDESKFGKRKYHRGHGVDGVWMLGMVEKTPERRIILIHVPVRNRATLERIIMKYVRHGSTVRTDKWGGYARLSSLGYIHETVNPSFKDPVTGAHTNTIEGNWSPLKRFVPPRCRTRQKIDIYLAMFM